MSDARATEWIRRATSAWARASQVRTLYERLAEIFYPEREDFHHQHSLGLERYDRIMDAEPVLLRRELGDGFGGMLRPRGKDWFFARAKPTELNDQYDVSAWLDHVNERLREELYKPRTRFEIAMREADHDFVCFGTSIVAVTLNRKRDGLLFRCVHPRDVAFELDEEEHVSVLYQQLTVTADQAHRLFGDLPRHMAESLKPGADRHKQFKLWRVVAPKEQHDWRQRPPTTASTASLYIDPVEHKFLAEAHVRVNPFQVRRWMTVSGEGWGRSPCTSAALADSRTLNTAQRALLEGLEKAIDPPMGASSKVQAQEINLYAGGVTFLGDVDDVQRHFRPVQDGARVDYGMEFTRERREFLGRAMLQSLLRLPAEQQMTAYEASQRVEEWVRNASPVFEPMQADNADLMDRVLALALFEMHNRRGLFEPPPEAVLDEDGQREIVFEFEDRLAEARRRLKLYKTREFEQEIAAHAQVVSAGDPQKAQMVLAKINWDEVLKAKREAYPAKWFRSDEEAAEAAEMIELEQGGQRLLEMASQAPPELLGAGMDLLALPAPEDGEAAPVQNKAGQAFRYK